MTATAPDQQLATRYEDGGRDWHLPEDLAVYWHLHLVEEGRAVEARAWRHWLDQLSALGDVDSVPWMRNFRGEELAVRTALLHLRARAAALAKACRKGRLPEGERPGFREVLRKLNARGPKSLSER